MYYDTSGYLSIIVTDSDGVSTVMYLVGSYKDLKKLARGTGLEVHHLIEKRFWETVPEIRKIKEVLP